MEKRGVVRVARHGLAGGAQRGRVRHSMVRRGRQGLGKASQGLVWHGRLGEFRRGLQGKVWQARLGVA